MKQTYIIFLYFVLLGGCISHNSNDYKNRYNADTNRERHITEICDYLFVGCHGNTFRNLNNNWTALDLINASLKNSPNKHLIFRDNSSIVDTTAGQIEDNLYCDSIEYEVEPISSKRKVEDSKLIVLTLDFRIKNFAQASELMDSMETRLANIYNRDNDLNVSLMSPALKEYVDALKSDPYFKSIKCVHTAYIDFLIVLKTTKELILFAHFT